MSADCYIRISVPILPRRTSPSPHRSRCRAARGGVSGVRMIRIIYIIIIRESHNGFASYPGSVPNTGHQLDQRAPATAANISHTYSPTRHSIVPSCSHVLLVSRSRRFSPWITMPLSSVSFTVVLSFSLSFSFEWRAIELLRADKRETQFKLRLLAVVTTVIITLAFHGDFYTHIHGRHAVSCSKFTERSYLRDTLSIYIVRDKWCLSVIKRGNVVHEC